MVVWFVGSCMSTTAPRPPEPAIAADSPAIDDWETALSEAGIDRYADLEGATWRRDLEQVIGRDTAVGAIEVYAGVLDADPLVLVLVVLNRDPADGSVRASKLVGRPVTRSQGPLVGEFGLLPDGALEALLETFENAVRSRFDRQSAAQDGR